MEVDDQGDVGGSSLSSLENKLHKNPKELIEHYFLLLTQGCGNTGCTNQYCASSPQFHHRTSMSPNEAAIEAIRLVKQKVNVQCTVVQEEPMVTQPTTSTSSSVDTSNYSSPTTSSQAMNRSTIVPLSLSLVHKTIQACEEQQKWSELVKLVGRSFSEIDVLLQSFRLDTSNSICNLDRESLQEMYADLFSVGDEPRVFTSALINAIINLSTSLAIELQYRSAYERDPNIINVILIILSMPCLASPEFLEQAYPEFLKAVTHLPLQGQKHLVQIFVSFGEGFQKFLLFSLQTLITLRVCSPPEPWSSRHLPNNDSHVTSAAKVMKLLYYASLLGGKMDTQDTQAKEKENHETLKKSVQEFIQSATQSTAKDKSEHKEDPLAQALGINSLDCREPVIPRQEFINSTINDILEMDIDFTYYRAETEKFSFIRHSFLLNTPTKSLAMYYDNRVRMLSERRTAILSSLISGGQHVPYLRLRVRRDHLIADALVELEVAYMDNPSDLKKQLYVEFEGEQGIDEGGVSKEFFQLITEEIFNPDFGMFVYDEDTRQFWFNPDSFENDAQFTLVGILLGLAIYNNIILDVNLPMVVYRKLMGKLGSLEDMSLSHPVLHSSLKQMLEYEGNVEEDLMTSFVFSARNMFGEIVSHPLKEGGADMFVTNDNSEEYCALYADYMLNHMVEKQFNAFYRGFHMVTDESPLHALFTPEEVEELVCGSDDWDLQALEASTEYDGGFDKDSDTIKHFWEVVHAMSVDDHKRLLQFVSGSNRVPVGGLAKLKLVIAKNGPDSDRLPTSHTCFNVLLLPDYQNVEKLKERLLLAITHAKGFGML